MDTQITDGRTVYRTSKIVLFRLDPNGGLPWVLFVYTKWCIYRPAGWYFPGGGEKPEDNGSFIKIAQRELLEETGYSVPTESFSEDRAIDCRPFRSNKKGYDFVQVRFYFVLWDENIGVGSFTDTNEIEKHEWFRLDRIPLPKSSKPSSPRHLKYLRILLRSLIGKMEQIQEWLYEFETSMQSAGLERPLYFPGGGE